jgi:hypothetical protein
MSRRKKTETPRCRRCHRKLTDERSIAQGMGETCRRKLLGLQRRVKAKAGEGQMSLPFKQEIP